MTMNRRKLLQLLCFALLALSCASAKTYVISEEVQGEVDSLIRGRNYNVYFTQPTKWEDPRRQSTEVSGSIRIPNDTLWYMFWHPVYTLREKHSICEYKQVTNERGETLISFFVNRYDEKQKKEVRLPFLLRIYTPSRIDVTIDGDTYFGCLNGAYLHFNL